MKIRKWIGIAVLAAVLALAAWLYYDIKYVFPHETMYIPGRDTFAYWNEGACEILRNSSNGVENYDVFVNHCCLTDGGVSLIAYGEVGTQVYFTTTKGMIVFDLTNNTYKEYGETKPIDAEHLQSFTQALETDAFTWLNRTE